MTDLGPAVSAVKLGLAPAFGMLICSLVGLHISPPKSLSGAMQHFSAGLLLSAVAQELVPPMMKAEGLSENLAVCMGFMSGVFVMIMIGAWFPEQHGLSRSFIAGGGTRAFPLALLGAVVIDGCNDGMLLGIASAGNETAGLVLAVSLAIDSSFLGLTLATSMKGQPVSKSVPALLAAPVAIIATSAIGGFFAGLLAEANIFKVGMLSFGAAAVLYMVAEQLLLKAHEDHGHHVWWVDGMLYVGFLTSIYLTKALGESE